jgi:stage III sporulation protein AG
MELIQWKEKLPSFLKKYKYAILVLLIGISFLLIPDRNNKSEEVIQVAESQNSVMSLEENLAKLLSMVQGAGKVRVMLTVANGEEYVYQTDSSISTTTNGSDHKSDTVVVTDGQRNDVGLLRQVNSPVYLGAVIVCQGADLPAVRLAITDAVAKLTGLGTDKISVIKMK